MTPAISNIAWPAADDDEALAFATSLGFLGIEVAPMRVFGPLDTIDINAVRRYRMKLSERGLVIPSLQGILFGVSGVHLFKDDAHRARLREALLRISDIAAALEAGACVFGAPQLRDPGDLSPSTARQLAVEFFRSIGPDFAARGVALCFEANPLLYQCRFVTGTFDAFQFVNEVADAGVRLQLDTGTMIINSEPVDQVPALVSTVGHCHISEPWLGPVGGTNYEHRRFAAALRTNHYAKWLSIEMKEAPTWRRDIGRATKLLRDAYELDVTAEATP